jgi:hypothetical protein
LLDRRVSPWQRRRFLPYRTSSRPAFVACSAASTPAGGRPPRAATSRTRATTSGVCSPTPGSRRGCWIRGEQWDLLGLGYGLTNAAYRTTKGSSDLRRADFAGAAERLERLAAELEPGTMAFVGKSSYQGAFGVSRSELGLQERTLGRTTLFVLPSTSPANAAVPYEERLAWFRRLAEHLGS